VGERIGPLGKKHRIIISALMDAVKDVNFGCMETCKKLPAACCGPCRDHVGYLPCIPEEFVQFYAERFDEKRGFWTDRGCSLPQEYRSPMCTGYYCKAIGPNIRLNDAVLLTLLYDYFRHIYHYKQRNMPQMFKKMKINEIIDTIQNIKRGHIPSTAPIPQPETNIIPDGGRPFPDSWRYPPQSTQTLGEIYGLDTFLKYRRY